MNAQPPHRTGYVVLAGRPNVGKSTLLNRLIGRKISITSPRPQTTRHSIVGVLSEPDAQFVFVDTPGLQARHSGRLNRSLNRMATDALEGVDVVVLVIEALHFSAEDRAVLARISAGTPVVLAINKVDKVSDKNRLLPFIEQVSGARDFAAIVPVSARTGKQLDELLTSIKQHLPAAAPIYGEDEITDRSERFLAAELLREKVFRLLGEEVPYAVAVEIEHFETAGSLRRIGANILVDRAAHKGIVIGKGGEQLKEIASQARQDMEKLFGGKVYLEVWVKVKRGWSENLTILRRLGYE